MKRGVFVPLVSAFLSLSAPAQVTPDRAYYPRYRPMPFTVRIPSDAAGEATVRLYEPGASASRHSAPVAAGPINLASVFPTLWREKAEDGPPPTLMYVQLAVGDKRIGPAVVIQPLIDPAYAPLLEADGTPTYRASRGLFSGFRAYVERDIVLETTLGDITLALRPDCAPNTSWHFLQLAAGGFYTDILIHRIKPTHPNGAPFIIQAGDPLQRPEASAPGAGEGGPGFSINLEPSNLPHDFGVVAMARNNLPNSAGSQFYFALSRKGTDYLDGKYTTFAQVVSGGEVLQKIAGLELVPGSDRPKDPPIIKRCRLTDAPPRGDGPRPVSKPPATQPAVR